MARKLQRQENIIYKYITAVYIYGRNKLVEWLSLRMFEYMILNSMKAELFFRMLRALNLALLYSFIRHCKTSKYTLLIWNCIILQLVYIYLIQ